MTQGIQVIMSWKCIVDLKTTMAILKKM